ncbi:sugar phosphate isomerase/epimerase family protein [Cohnella cholangitidis]|uniref:Sugar phosphate isomerase/epimerase n=1 Tax=Cohnella cholangitidis TaxID=2598458 RepID=A0A7G5C554_9BACL|nr:sugar phosphate isomerase/epimerase family protein [Cohnella cholangitidis]QMV44338.1 sugar phosphate isomerase/epimerase [Cohnella cholangitidis]
MRKGINIWSFPAHYSIDTSLSLAAEAGFEGIELSLDEEGELSLGSSEADLNKLRDRAKDLGLQLPSLASGLFWNYSLTSSQSDIRAKAYDIARKQLECAAILGANTVLIVPGAVGVDFIPGSEVVPYEQAYDYALEAFVKLAREAESLQVSIGIENVWNKFLLSPLEMRGFIDQIASPFVGSYFDVGNVVYSGYPEHWIRILAHRIKKVHFKDYRREAGGLHGFVDLLAGDVDYPEVVKALQDIGYDDYVTAEMIPPYKHHAEQIIYNTSNSMDQILGRGRA